MRARISVLISVAALPLIAAAPRAPNLLRDAFSPVVTLEAEKSAALSGNTDGESVTVDLSLGKGAALEKLTISQNDRDLLVPPSALLGLTGAQRAWLEERGALTTLVIEGSSEAKDWRLALEFHETRLWLRRLSREGVKQDSFIYYDRDNLKPQREQRRHFHNRGFNQPYTKVR